MSARSGEVCGGNTKAGGVIVKTDHGSVEVGLPLVRGRIEGELGDAENVAVNVFDILLPHRA